MTVVVEARAPGKLFLLGEYAVLDGCPAVVAAVDRHVTARVSVGAPGSEVCIEAQEHGVMRFDARNAPPEDGPLRFVIAAWRGVAEQCPWLTERTVSIVVSSTLDDPLAGKSGLGGSAAVVVATTAALRAAAELPADAEADRRALLATALAAHRRAQGGAGSGADVAASVTGGAIVFEPRGEALPAVTPLPWPAGARLLAAWSGEPASTPALVREYRARAAAPGHTAFLERTRKAVTDFVGALREGRLAPDAVNEAGDALARLGADLGLPIMTPALRALVDRARACGAAAKPSGAGGGDCAVALAPDARTAAAVERSWAAGGFTVLDLGLAAEGVTCARC